MSILSPTTIEIARLLNDIGWRSTNDAQWTQLDAAVQDGRFFDAMFADELDTKRSEEAQEANIRG